MTERIIPPQYPLTETAVFILRTANGRPLEEIHMENVVNGEVTIGDLRIHGETLQAQAEIARQAGYHRLAENLARAAELTRVPNEDLLRMYESLRPDRSNYDQLIKLAEELEGRYHATQTGRFIREAARVYLERGLLKQDPIPGNDR
jgi:propanediol dehydratase small subunit